MSHHYQHQPIIRQDTTYYPPPCSTLVGSDDGGWSWTVVDEHSDETIRYRTDQRGDGLWRELGPSVADDRQVLGHAQWSVRGLSGRARRRRVLRKMAERHGEVAR